MAILLKSRKSLNIEEQKGKALKAFSYFSRKKVLLQFGLIFSPAVILYQIQKGIRKRMRRRNWNRHIKKLTTSMLPLQNEKNLEMGKRREKKR